MRKMNTTKAPLAPLNPPDLSAAALWQAEGGRLDLCKIVCFVMIYYFEIKKPDFIIRCG